MEVKHPPGKGSQEAGVPSPAHLTALAAWRQRTQGSSQMERTCVLQHPVEGENELLFVTFALGFVSVLDYLIPSLPIATPCAI